MSDTFGLYSSVDESLPDAMMFPGAVLAYKAKALATPEPECEPVEPVELLSNTKADSLALTKGFFRRLINNTVRHV
jgi:hypothetical protein